MIKFIVGATIGRPLLTITENKGGRTQFAPTGKTIKFIVGATNSRPLLTITANKGGRTQFAPTIKFECSLWGRPSVVRRASLQTKTPYRENDGVSFSLFLLQHFFAPSAFFAGRAM